MIKIKIPHEKQEYFLSGLFPCQYSLPLVIKNNNTQTLFKKRYYLYHSKTLFD